MGIFPSTARESHAVRQTARFANGDTDSALVIEAQRGQSWAMEALLRRHLAHANAVAFTIIGPDADREDVVQECMVSAARSINKLKTPSAFGAWLAAIVISAARKKFRRRLERTLLLTADSELTETAIQAVPARTTPPDVYAEWKALGVVLGTLTQESRVALLLKRVDGFSLDEIAQQMNLSVSTVKRRICAAQQVLDAVDRGA